MTNIQQLTLDLMLAHNIDYEEADRRARKFYDAVGGDRPDVLNDGWISVDDRLPESGKDVLVRVYGDFYRFDLLPFDDDVTHHQPLPSPPKEK